MKVLSDMKTIKDNFKGKRILINPIDDYCDYVTAQALWSIQK